MKTWVGEAAVVLAALAAASWANAHMPLIERLVVLAAVQLTFMHAQITDRLAAADTARAAPAVECRRWAVRYLVGKEALWILFFCLTGAYAAILGSAILAAYPLWRRLYRDAHVAG